MQTHFFIPTSPLDTGSTYYYVIRNPSDIPAPASSSVGGATAGGIFSASSNVFIDIAAVNCSDGASWAPFVISLPEESVACGGFYKAELPQKLQILGLTYDIVVFKQLGSSASFNSDTVVSTITHTVGEPAFSMDVEYVAGGQLDNSRIYINTSLNGINKSCVGSPVVSVASPASAGAVYNPDDGVYYCDIDISGLSQNAFVHCTVSASLTSQVWNGTSWSGGSGDAHAFVEKSIGLSKSGDIDSTLNQILNKPTID